MAEGEEETGDAMLAVSASPHSVMRREHSQPMNLKSEESDDDSSCTGSTSSSLSPGDIPLPPTNPDLTAQPVRGGNGGTHNLSVRPDSYLRDTSSLRDGSLLRENSLREGGQGHPQDRRQDEGGEALPLKGGNRQHRERSMSPVKGEGLDATKGQNHLNGLAGLMGLQNLAGLQNLHSQSNPPQHNSSQLLNTPLNLSINATGSMQVGANNGASPGVVPQAPPQLLTAPQPAAMPQFILASGQLVQGIQGAQLLIPTSQGIATQTILTIPVNHVTSNQIVNLALSNGQVITTTLANLQSMAQPHHLLAPTHSSVSSASPPIIPATGLSPANATLTSQLLNGHSTATNLNNNLASVANCNNGLPTQHNLNQSNLSGHLGSNGSLQGQAGQAQGQSHSQGQSHQQQLINALQQHQQQQQQQNANGGQMSVQRSPNHFSNADKSPPHPSAATNGLLPNGGGVTPSSSMPSSPLNTAVINRLAATNSDLTITTTSTPNSKQHQHINNNNNNYAPQSMQHSPAGIDLLDDSPNQPTISQSNCNMVDGINLDEIKEFAKAFKLRRLSLGLTQTQVGQALSITEGPAYSQSAICSALATQMYCAAQLATAQQQSMYVQPECNSNARFEKLDITPKSAQKIKPVLERWMKEAEERYKSGQNHLTEFIGVEPSKKRKRRTSFTPQALELLNAHFERNTHPSGTEITTLAHQLGYEREVIRIWFCNKRQALKNTVRMMSKGGCPT
ncbi:POU domain, class 6, transcription factor 2 isoform X2 [Nilaparvata lugens]|uniref:POU domain, class 6, transcription factor 2 isoform X2 n=1 Tax=Nilaparvata lugens TaxID=108931 RepID=UPI00193D6CE3|nr:POU domain, class 6, transcription factor 2 isoform X2 [Nilaparvata lugens]